MIGQQSLRVSLGIFLMSVFCLAHAQDARNIVLLKEFVMPAYQEMLAVNQNLDATTQNFCATPSKKRLEDVRQAFNLAMDSNQYAGVSKWQHTGSMYLWDRLNYFPDVRGKTVDQLRRLVAAADPVVLEPIRFAKGSFALQGLGAFEILLFDEDTTLQTFTTESGNSSYSCQVLQAISQTISMNTQNMLNQWTVGLLNYSMQLSNPSNGMSAFDDNEHVVVDVVTDLRMTLFRIAMIKLDWPARRLEKGQQAREENWRSDRWLRNITINLEAANKLYLLGLVPRLIELEAGKPLAVSGKKLFERAMTLADEIGKSSAQDFSQLVNTEKFLELKAVTLELEKLIAKDMSDALTTAFGFNFQDGD